jgi:Tol biopolymer transport system component
MQVAAGTRLGPYEVVSRLGAGGMGEVWRARDTRLDRSVAIKIIPPELAHRFEREARAISQLNHPHICVLHDVGENYLVMELLEGETLADRVARGAMPIHDVLTYGVQIAEALDRAHRAGIVHRDLKPSNVMLTKSGAKLLDFGLAKQSPLAVNPDGLTEQKPLTEEGTIVGTFQYMAPEQLEGENVDARSDIFALGALLYEMVTGRRAFAGKTRTSLIAAIVAGEPKPISQLQPLAPPALEHVVAKCLAKNPDDRWQSAHDIAEELRWIATDSGAAAAVPKRRQMQWLAWAVTALALVAAVAAIVTRPKAAAPRVESAIVPPVGYALSYTAGPIALSADGRQLAFVARGADGRRSLWVRLLASSAARLLPGTDDARFPFWSPDGKYLGFIADAKLKKVAVAGGAPETLAEVEGASGAAWNREGDIVVTSSRFIDRVPANGGKVVHLVDIRDRFHLSPWFLPDGRHFLFTAFSLASPEAEGIWVGSLDGDPPRRIMLGPYSNAVYTAPGMIVYWRNGELRAQRFDLKAMKPEGEPTRLADHVESYSVLRMAQFAVSEHTLVYIAGEGLGKSQLTWVGRDGKQLGVLAPPKLFFSPRLSHDEKHLAVDLSDAQTTYGDIWIFDLVRGGSTRLTWNPANESIPVWSADDRRVVYVSQQSGGGDLYQRSASGTGNEELLLGNTQSKEPLDISPDGQWLVYLVPDEKHSDFSLLNLTTRKATPWLTSPFWQSEATFSPDGKWIAYTSAETGQNEVYVRSFPESTDKWLISRGGGRSPTWRGDGRELYYVSWPQRKMMAVPITLQPAFDAGTPVALFDSAIHVAWPRQYCVTRDGQRFLINCSEVEQATRPITLVQNWQ